MKNIVPNFSREPRPPRHPSFRSPDRPQPGSGNRCGMCGGATRPSPNAVARFMTDCALLPTTPKKVFQRRLSEWCRRTNTPVPSDREVREELMRLGITEARGRDGDRTWYWLGLALTDDIP